MFYASLVRLVGQALGFLVVMGNVMFIMNEVMNANFIAVDSYFKGIYGLLMLWGVAYLGFKGNKCQCGISKP